MIDDQIDAILAISPPGETIDSVIELVAARLRQDASGRAEVTGYACAANRRMIAA